MIARSRELKVDADDFADQVRPATSVPAPTAVDRYAATGGLESF